MDSNIGAAAEKSPGPLGLDEFTRDQLVELVGVLAKNMTALDGTWFQSLEDEGGMDIAMEHDAEAWRRFMPYEVRRLKAFLGLGERPGLDGLAKVLPLHCTSLPNVWEIERPTERELIFRMTDCRVQNARERKGMELHPCKMVGAIEYEEMAKAIDDRISCECLSCYPEITDDTCNCAWRFTLEGK